MTKKHLKNLEHFQHFIWYKSIPKKWWKSSWTHSSRNQQELLEFFTKDLESTPIDKPINSYNLQPTEMGLKTNQKLANLCKVPTKTTVPPMQNVDGTWGFDLCTNRFTDYLKRKTKEANGIFYKTEIDEWKICLIENLFFI